MKIRPEKKIHILLKHHLEKKSRQKNKDNTSYEDFLSNMQGTDELYEVNGKGYCAQINTNKFIRRIAQNN
jgi:hypothetical protein